MKKFCALLLLAALVSVLAACNNNGGNKIVVVDGAKVFRESKPGQEAMAYLRTKSSDLQAEAKSAQEKVQAKQTKENAAAFQAAVTKYQTTMSAEQQRVVGLLQDQFNKILEKYRKDNKVDVILAKDVVLSYDENADITNKIIEEINKVAIDLNAKPEEKKADDKAAAPEAKPADEKKADDKKPEAKPAAPAAAAPEAKKP
jgi:outer membrane protein